MRLRASAVVGLVVACWAVGSSVGRGAEDADPWEIPVAASETRNPLSSSTAALGVARVLWRTHCETCHGVEGRGDGPNARLHERRKNHAPRNLTKPNVQENLTDGDIFWRVSKGIIEGGNVIMPAYEGKVPSETERWLLVLYVRELGRRAADPGEGKLR